ncbi:MAG TPA: ATP-binding cassette domain-containing protein [Paludibacter sp.]|nr:ATP-binding cassette domain-containing protein [Paludibacter sp.]
MEKTKGIGLYLSNKSDKNLIINKITSNSFLLDYQDLSSLKGVLHSAVTIDKLIREEILHDKFIVKSIGNQSLGSMSSGQQKRALLTYLVSQKPGYMVLDDIYSNIDQETLHSITNELARISTSTFLVQIFFRKQDLLPFIPTVLTVDENNQVVSVENAGTFLQAKSTHSDNHTFTLPEEYDENHSGINPLVQLNQVSVRYGAKPVLDKISWTIRKGEFWQLKGPNGSGKSTMLSVIVGDNPRGYGQDMVLFGRKKGSGESIWDIKRQIGYFTPSMTHQFTRDESVENMIISGLLDSVGLYTEPSDMQRDIAKKWLGCLDPSYRHKSFQSLSIGQQRMVMTARAMVKHPPLLILDEPTIELDDENSRIFTEMVNAIASTGKVAIIYVSHRDEPGLNPDKIFELVAGENGSIGVIRP